MDQSLIEKLYKQLGIAREHIIREYYEMILLQAFSDSNLTKDLIFYGGTALRLAYRSPRFSEDIDFLMHNPVTKERLETILKNVCFAYPELSLVEVVDKRFTLFALIKIRHQSLKHHRHIKIEISKLKDGVQFGYQTLSSECSNFNPIILTADLAAIESLKQKTVRDRRVPRDWFDLWYLSQRLMKPFPPQVAFPFKPEEFKRELKRQLGVKQWVLIDEILKKISSPSPS